MHTGGKGYKSSCGQEPQDIRAETRVLFHPATKAEFRNISEDEVSV